jgi:hypothetical protein
VVSFVCGVTVIFPFLYGDHLAHLARQGLTVEVAVLPGIAGLRADAVLVYPSGSQPFTPSTLSAGQCYLRLGSNDGITVLYDYRSSRVIRIGNTRLIATQTC